MGFRGIHSRQHSEPMAEINMVPLIDIMLVLLIIFIVAAPLLTHAVQLQLPKASNQAQTMQHDAINLSMGADGTLFWNQEILPPQALQTRLENLAKTNPNAHLRLSADGDLAYKQVAYVLAQAARLGLVHVALVTEPKSD